MEHLLLEVKQIRENLGGILRTADKSIHADKYNAYLSLLNTEAQLINAINQLNVANVDKANTEIETVKRNEDPNG